MNEQLIELVRSQTILYDTNDPNYLKAKLKDELWNDIGKKLNLKSGNEAKTLWLKLRNCHRDALRRQKKCLKSGAAAVVIKKWKFQKQMNFLIPYMSNRSREGNLQEDSEDEDLQQEDSIVDPDSEIFDEVASDIRHDTEEIESVKNDIVDEPSTSGIVIQKNNEKGNAKRKATADQSITTKPAKNNKPKNDDIQEVIKQSIIQRQKRAEERAVERAVQKPLDDDLYHFYMSMYKITKKMSPKFQHRARNDVFQAISQLEAAYLEMQDPSQENYTHREQRVFTGAYVNTHIQQPSYSSTPLPSPSSSHSSQNTENQHYNNPLAPMTNNSFLCSSAYNSRSTNNNYSSTTLTPRLSTETSPQTANTGNIRNFVENYRV
ncbi:uncharacterized protein LOC126893284 [Diabrotica virgifera virgifera]|uniref:MADF domain-containing protein n=1 Tax=Diabrotica virgifera virgifera TaxID=50390 RepID=A0ABM5LA02_DIAVI|nr:uncharacterized protein LOC126893284 [Diabrotica virgifera virgifera]